MKPVRVLILRTAGTNCDLETEAAFRLAGAKPERVHVRRVLEGAARLLDYHILVFPGGFSYGDDVGAGKILANELRKRLFEIRAFVRSGRPVLGICNGFQVLVKAGILPHSPGLIQTASLAFNDSNRFEARWVKLRINRRSRSPFFQGLPEIIELPVAHGEGKVVFGSPKTLEDLKRTGSIALQYVDGEGSLAGYPHNPNGSVFNIAGLTNPDGNCLGLMPHPERYLTPFHHPRWTRRTYDTPPAGLQVILNAVEYARQ